MISHDPVNPAKPPTIGAHWTIEESAPAAMPAADSRIDFRYWLGAIIVGILLWVPILMALGVT